jgi:hypothetical protein
MSFGDADAQQGALKGSASAGEIGWLFESLRQLPLRLSAGLHRFLEIDLRGHVSRLGHDHDLVRPDLQEATRNREVFDVAPPADAQLPESKRRQQWRMVRQDPKLPLDPRAHDRINLVTEDLPFRRDYFEK